MLTISVKNFGPIAEGSVDLKPLTIFVGPSNTGKSYMATAVYAVMNGWPPGRQNLRFSRRNPIFESFENAPDDIVEWAWQIIRRDSTSTPIVVGDLPHDIRCWLESSTSKRLEFFGDSVLDQLNQVHGGESGLVRAGCTPEDFLLVIRGDSSMLRLIVNLGDELGVNPEFNVSGINVPTHVFDFEHDLLGTQEENDVVVRSNVAAGLLRTTIAYALSELSSPCFYLPAARSGIAQGHKVLAAALVRQSLLIGIERLNIPTLPGITTEFLSHLISLDKQMAGPKLPPGLNDAISFIENEVLQGEIDLDESAGLPYPEIAYTTASGKFTLEHTSSMVSELAPLILFLKYLVRPGNLLILEEPESNLHPAAQLQLARGIVRLVNAGVKVLITTHSGDFMGQINNLISMSNVSEETWASLGLEREDCLQTEHVSAYGFRIDSDKGGAVTYPLPVGTDVGIEEEEFLPISELLYEQAITLQRNRLT